MHYEAGRQLRVDRPLSSYYVVRRMEAAASDGELASPDADGGSSKSDDWCSDLSLFELENELPLPASASSAQAELRLRELEARGLRRQEVASIKSGKWMFRWVLRGLDKRQARLVIEGLRFADSLNPDGAFQNATKSEKGSPGDEMESSFASANVIFTSSVAFRDALVQLCLHAGFSAFFDVTRARGTTSIKWGRTISWLGQPLHSACCE